LEILLCIDRIEKSLDYDTCKPGDKVIEINDKPLGHYTLDDLDDLLNNPNDINTLKIETQGQLVTNDSNNNNNNNGIILNTIETVHKGLFNDLAKGRMRDCCMDQEYVLGKTNGFFDYIGNHQATLLARIFPVTLNA
jgi:hypothetical protein